jgi:hypothetical protein
MEHDILRNPAEHQWEDDGDAEHLPCAHEHIIDTCGRASLFRDN